MSKSKKIFFFIIIFLTISTYYPKTSKSPFVFLDNYFGIKFIHVTNNFLVKEAEIKKKFATIYNRNIFFIKKKEVSDLLKDIDLIESFNIKKIFPDRILVKIKEEIPIAILNRKKEKFFITEANHLIEFRQNIIRKNLPYVFGYEAEKEFIKFYELLQENDFPINLIKNFYFFKINRWDLHLLNEKVIKFPPNMLDQSIKKAIYLLQAEEFKRYNIIDLRISGKMIMQ